MKSVLNDNPEFDESSVSSFLLENYNSMIDQIREVARQQQAEFKAQLSIQKKAMQKSTRSTLSQLPNVVSTSTQVPRDVRRQAHEQRTQLTSRNTTTFNSPSRYHRTELKALGGAIKEYKIDVNQNAVMDMDDWANAIDRELAHAFQKP